MERKSKRRCPKRPSQAMQPRPRLATPLPPTTTTTAFLHPASLLDLADELWFSSSVLPFPSFSDLPCLPLFSSLFSNSPDPSTLLAQLMFSTTLSRPPPSSISSSSSSSSPFLPPSLQQTPLLHSPWDLPAYLTLPSPSDGKDVQSYGEDEDAYHRVHSHGHACSYGTIQDPYPAQVGSDRDEDTYAEYAYPVHCYVEDDDANLYGNAGPAQPSYDKDEDAYPAFADDGENAGHADTIEEQQQEVQDCEHADIPVFPGDLDAEDALRGIYDVGVLLKDQQYHKQRGDTEHKGRQDVLDAVCPESSPRRAGPFQYGGEGKNVKVNVGNTKTSIGNRERDTTAITPHVAKRNMGIREPDMTGMAPHVAKTNLGNRELDMTGMAPNVARSMPNDGRHDMGNRELDMTSMAPHVGRSMLNDGRRDNSLTLSYVPIHNNILPIMSALPSVQVLSCNEQAEVKENLKLWAHVVASNVHLKAELRAKRVL